MQYGPGFDVSIVEYFAAIMVIHYLTETRSDNGIPWAYIVLAGKYKYTEKTMVSNSEMMMRIGR